MWLEENEFHGMVLCRVTEGTGYGPRWLLTPGVKRYKGDVGGCSRGKSLGMGNKLTDVAFAVKAVT